MKPFIFGAIFGITGLAAMARIRLNRMLTRQLTPKTVIAYLMENDPIFKLQVELTTWMMNAPGAGYDTEQIHEHYRTQMDYIRAIEMGQEA